MLKFLYDSAHGGPESSGSQPVLVWYQHFHSYNYWDNTTKKTFSTFFLADSLIYV